MVRSITIGGNRPRHEDLSQKPIWTPQSVEQAGAKLIGVTSVGAGTVTAASRFPAIAPTLLLVLGVIILLSVILYYTLIKEDKDK